MSRHCHLLVIFAIALGCLPLTANGEKVSTSPEDCLVAEVFPRPSVSGSAVVPVGINRDTTDADTTETDTTDQIERKSPGRALLYSLGGTVVLAPVLGTGLIVGPAFGHYYANNRLQASIGAGIRGLSAGAVLIGLFGTTTEAFTDPDFYSDSENMEDPGNSTSAKIGAVGLRVLLASALVDIVMAPFAAQDFNEARGITARVGPAVGPGAEQVGLALKVQF